VRLGFEDAERTGNAAGGHERGADHHRLVEYADRLTPTLGAAATSETSRQSGSLVPSMIP
jgi:hypothetical protein